MALLSPTSVRSTRARVLVATLTAAVVLGGGTVTTASAGGAGRTRAPAATTSSGMPSGTVVHAAATDPGWTTFDQNGLRTGVDASGSSFSSATAAWTSPALDGQLYGQPLIAAGLVYAATENDTVYALDVTSGTVVWKTHVGTAFDPSTVSGLCGNIHPTVGITSTPVIDTTRNEIFVVAAEQAGSEAAHHLVRLDLTSGAVVLDEVVDPASVTSPAHELQRTSLALTTGRVIIGFGGNSGDCDPYHGLVVSAPEDGSAPSDFVVANQPGDSQGAVWMGGASPSVDAQGDVWVATGNSADTTSTASDASDSVLKLSPTAQLLDSFTPASWHVDNGSDADLGSTTPALLPNGTVFEVGKAKTAYVLRQSGLGGIGGQVSQTTGFCGSNPDGGSADLNGTLFVPCGDGIRAVAPTASTSPLTTLWASSSGAHGSPIVAGNLVWSIGGGVLFALDPATGATVDQFTIGSTPSSFPSPAADDGLVIAPSANQLHAFAGPDGPTGTVVVTSNHEPSRTGQPVTFTAKVTGVAPGSVTFTSDGVSLGTAAMVRGKAKLVTTALLAGTHLISASIGATVGTVSQTVDPAITTTALTASPRTTPTGHSVTVTATVTRRKPARGSSSGTVTFSDGAAAFATVSLVGGTASTTLVIATTGRHPLTASFSGGPDDQASVSKTVQVTGT